MKKGIKEKVIDEYKKGKKWMEISKENNFNSRYVRFILKDNNLPFMTKREELVNMRENFIRENYPKYGNKYCQKALNMTCPKVSSYVKKLGLKKFVLAEQPVADGYLRCFGECKRILLKENFYKTKHIYRSCKECIKKVIERRKIKLSSNPKERRKNTIKRLLSGAKRRSKIQNISFDLDYKWVDENFREFCPILGFKFELNHKYPKSDSPTIDRINPNLGYEKNNCRIISWRANTLKNDGTAEEHRKIADYIDKNSIK